MSCERVARRVEKYIMKYYWKNAMAMARFLGFVWLYSHVAKNWRERDSSALTFSSSSSWYRLQVNMFTKERFLVENLYIFCINYVNCFSHDRIVVHFVFLQEISIFFTSFTTLAACRQLQLKQQLYYSLHPSFAYENFSHIDLQAIVL